MYVQVEWNPEPEDEMLNVRSAVHFLAHGSVTVVKRCTFSGEPVRIEMYLDIKSNPTVLLV